MGGFTDAWFRSVPVRFLGYGMAVGECIKYVSSPGMVDACYTTHSVFSLCHMICVFVHAGSLGPVLRTWLWEALASSFMPTLLVFHMTSLVAQLMGDLRASKELQTWAPCLVGLGLCVVVQEPLDKLADDIVGIIFRSPTSQ